MEKEQVIERFCKLAGKVNEKVFNWQIPSDCFCNAKKECTPLGNFAFSIEVLEFIESAVEKEIEKNYIKQDFSRFHHKE